MPWKDSTVSDAVALSFRYDGVADRDVVDANCGYFPRHSRACQSAETTLQSYRVTTHSHSILLPGFPCSLPLPSKTTLLLMSLTASSSKPLPGSPGAGDPSGLVAPWKRASKDWMWGAVSSSSSGASCLRSDGNRKRLSRSRVLKLYFAFEVEACEEPAVASFLVEDPDPGGAPGMLGKEQAARRLSIPFELLCVPRYLCFCMYAEVGWSECSV